jgi:hypothetical protein
MPEKDDIVNVLWSVNLHDPSSFQEMRYPYDTDGYFIKPAAVASRGLDGWGAGSGEGA